MAMRVYREAGVEGVAQGGAAELARHVFGADVLYRQPRALAEAHADTIDGKRRIVVRAGLPARRANFAIAQVIAELVTENEAWVAALSDGDRDFLLRRIGACIVAPRELVRAQIAQVGVHIRTLAEIFTVTETSMAMRVAEVEAVPGVAVATQDAVHRRGKALAWLCDEDVRRLAKKTPRSVRKVAIRDEPGRVALLAKAG